MATQRRDYAEEKDKIKEFLTGFYIEEESTDGETKKVWPYNDQITELANRRQIALHIELDHVRIHDPDLMEAIEANTNRYQSLFADAVDDLIKAELQGRPPPVLDALDTFIYQRLQMFKKATDQAENENEAPDARKQYPPELLRRFEIYFKTQTNAKPMSVRDVKADLVGKIVTLRGIVIRSTEVKPMASVITYTCDTCANETYQPVTGASFMPQVNCPSKACTENRAGGRLMMQVRGSKFVKFQEIRIQEHSEQVPVGSIPRSLTVYVQGENTRKAGPGDDIQLTGVFLPKLKAGFAQMIGGLLSEVYIEVHHIENIYQEDEQDLEKDEDELLTPEEREVAQQENFYDLLTYSIAPEIFGHQDIKKSLLLQLVGGVDKNAAGMKIRGAVNICLMGDPGVAKSQLLSHIDRLSPRSQYTTGRGSSGVGLTAAVMRDPVTGDMTLEGGALVLADRGICCIDEFDKMMESDRTAIHEVMEQQTISIAKGGIMTTLNARVSILAAANPAYGRYNPKKSIEHNIQLPAALLSRFDLLWLIQDKPDRDNDLRLAQHITYVHTHSKQPPREGVEPLDMKLIRRYIAVCKRKQPIIPERMTEQIVQSYVDLRKEARNNRDTTFTSPRNVLAVIRLSTALARLRLADEVTEGDINEACRLLERSKLSLLPDMESGGKEINPIDRAFGILRDMFASLPPDEQGISIDEARKKIVNKGIDDSVLDECLENYERNGVFLRSKDKLILTVT